MKARPPFVAAGNDQFFSKARTTAIERLSERKKAFSSTPKSVVFCRVFERRKRGGFHLENALFTPLKKSFGR